MRQPFKITGTGYELGAVVIKNEDIARKINLKPDWFEKHTGIVERRGCSEEQDVITMAVASIKQACKNANLDSSRLDENTLLIHIQNGFTYKTPPPGILIAKALKSYTLKTLSIDGVCAEPINAIEIGALMLGQKRYKRVIISSSVNFLPIIDYRDKDTAGLFGAGAGAFIMEYNEDESGLYGLHWENHSDHFDLGMIKLHGYEYFDDGVSVKLGYYVMKGKSLATVALKVIPRSIKSAISQAQMQVKDLNYIVSHQPNEKLLDIGMKYLGLKGVHWFRHARNLGNIGPASLLIVFAIQMEKQSFKKGDNVLFLSFGLGFSCGAAVVKI